MKKYTNILFVLLPLFINAQNSEYNLNSYLDEGVKAPNTHYIGEAWLNGLLRADENLNYNITKATFRANSTLDWHKHTSPQVIIIVKGEGCDQDIEHWHSSTKENDVTYLAIYSGETIWTEVLSQENYDNVAEEVKKN